MSSGYKFKIKNNKFNINFIYLPNVNYQISTNAYRWFTREQSRVKRGIFYKAFLKITNFLLVTVYFQTNVITNTFFVSFNLEMESQR